MSDQDLNSDSSDEDYIPDTEKQEILSEVDSDDDLEDDPIECMKVKKKRVIPNTQKEQSRKRTKKIYPSQELADEKCVEIEKDPQELSAVEKKKKDDDLWADFMKDTGFQCKSTLLSSSTTSSSSNNLKSTTKSGQKTTTNSSNSNNSNKTAQTNDNNKVKVKQIFQFAGEEIEVEKEVEASSAIARFQTHSSGPNNSKDKQKPNRSSSLTGLSGVLSHLGKKPKISTLEKSKLDWDRFKRDENITDDLETYRKGKDGYLDRQDFLERTDLRRFEIEKSARAVERSKRLNTSL